MGGFRHLQKMNLSLSPHPMGPPPLVSLALPQPGLVLVLIYPPGSWLVLQPSQASRWEFDLVYTHTESPSTLVGWIPSMALAVAKRNFLIMY